MSINVCNKRYDVLFLPILTYRSEVWGEYDRNENTTWESKTINFCKVFLGVNKRSQNATLRNELGRLPLKLQITQNIIKYWIHLEGLRKDSINSLCLEISNKMAKENKQYLTYKVNHILRHNNIDKSTINYDNPVYSSFKFDNKKSEFLEHVKNPLHRKIASKFRIGNQNYK